MLMTSQHSCMRRDWQQASRLRVRWAASKLYYEAGCVIDEDMNVIHKHICSCI